MLLVNGTVLTLGQNCRVLENGAVLIEDQKIAALGKTEELLQRAPQAERIDCSGKLIMPGFTCAHTHTYSTFARGMALEGEAPSNFSQVLERLWWRLDKALTLEDVYYSAMITFIGCIKNGTTALLDHHSSPGAAAGSLEQIAAAAGETGIRVNLCYEISDRDGEEKMLAGLAENIRFIQKSTSIASPLLSATLGMHASFTISKDTMEKCARAAHDHETGVHIHVCESSEDAEDSLQKYGHSVVERLNSYDLLGPRTLAAHCIHISESDMELLAQTKTCVAHNPQSNMNNAVGCAPVTKMIEHGVLVGMGSDGMSTDMVEGMKTAHILHKHCQKDPRVGWSEVPRMLFENNPAIMARYFPVTTGILAEGAAADIIVLDYDPPTPLTADNYYGHLVFGLSGGMVDTTIVAGKVLMKNRRLETLDEARINSTARKLATKLWNRL